MKISSTHLATNLAFALSLAAQPLVAAQPESLVLKPTANIQYTIENLKEPSGLALSHEKKALWVVSDDSTNIFKMEFNGTLKKNETIRDPLLKGLEGIAISNDGLYLYAVLEDNNKIVCVNIADKKVDGGFFISELTGYAEMRSELPEHFESGFWEKKGLEGIATHPVTGNIFVLMERGLLMEISFKEQRIVKFYDFDFAGDYSGIAFAQADQNRVWIISDKSKTIYLVDLDNASNSQVIGFYKLKNVRGKSYRSAEGVAYDAKKKSLYIVTDSKHQLLKYDIDFPVNNSTLIGF